MQVVSRHVDPLRHEFRITVPAHEIHERATARLRVIAERIRVSGFRSGKVRSPLVASRMGRRSARPRHRLVRASVSSRGDHQAKTPAASAKIGRLIAKALYPRSAMRRPHKLAPAAEPRFTAEPFSTIVVAAPAGLSEASIETMPTLQTPAAILITRKRRTTTQSGVDTSIGPTKTAATMHETAVKTRGEMPPTRLAATLPSVYAPPPSAYTRPAPRSLRPAAVWRNAPRYVNRPIHHVPRRTETAKNRKLGG